MKKNIKGAIKAHLPYLTVLLVAHVIIYHEYWLLTKYFTGADFFTQLVPLANFQSDCLHASSWPLWNPYMNFGYPWVDNYVNSSFSPTHLVLGYFSRFSLATAQMDVLGWILFGGIGMYLCILEYGLSWNAAVIAGLAFMFSGQLLSLSQGYLHVYNASCFPFAVLGYHRCMRMGRSLSILSIFFLSIEIFGGSTASAVLSIYLLSGYVLCDSVIRKSIKRGLVFLVVNLGLAALVCLPKLLPLYMSMMNSPRLAAPVYSDPRFGIVTLYNFLSYLLPVKYYFSLYIGETAIIALVYGAMSKRVKFDAALIMFVLSAWLLISDSSGSPSVLRYLAHKILPLTSLVRLEFIYWYYPTIFAILFASRSVDRLLTEISAKKIIVAVGIFDVLLTAFFLLEYDFHLFIRAYTFHLLISILLLLILIIVKNSYTRTALLAGLLVIESFTIFNRVNIDQPPVRKGDFIEIAATDQNYINQTFKNDELVSNTWKVRISDDRRRPTMSDSRQWPHLVSLTTGSPSPNWAEAMNMKQFTGWWYNTQERREFILLMKTPFFLQLDNQPLFSLFSRHTGELIGRTSFDAISCSSFDFSVNAAEPGFFLLNQMHDDRWKVFVDGKEQPLRRANEFFMGMEIAPGAHNVAFRFRDTTFMISFAISGMTIVLLSIYLVFRKRRKTKQNDGALLQHKSSS